VVFLIKRKQLMNGRKLSLIFAWTVAAVMVSMGIVVLAGGFLPETAPLTLRWMLGIVFLLMGVYRFLMTRMQVKQVEKPDE
jgi:cytochrome c biogenesis protein CcdA